MNMTGPTIKQEAEGEIGLAEVVEVVLVVANQVP